MDSDFFKDRSLAQWLVVFDPQQRIYVLYLASAFILALIAYRSLSRAEKDKGFFGYVFDRAIYGHRSAMQDYAIGFLNVGIVYILIAQFMVGSVAFTDVVARGLSAAFGERQTPLLQSGPARIGFTVAMLVLGDFALWLQHVLMHRIPTLWQFHKVHHSAEVMTPITTFRLHPVDVMFSSVTASLFAGFAYGLFWYLSGDAPRGYTILGLNAGLFLFYLFGYNLRHSHIWLSYPRWLSRIFISPAQHQIHHSTAPQHFDRNMGFIFAFWDGLYGSLVVPEKRETLQFGIARATPNPFPSVSALYWAPFKWAWNSLQDKKARAAFGNLLLVMGVIGLSVFMLHHAAVKDMPPSVNIQDLTWVEIHTAMAGGYDTVIIPTGGTEQNGSHEIIGKHNYIVAYTADKIARKIGGALVAPVMPYVPEGAIDSYGHMMFPGTATVSDAAFEAVLTSVADSYIHHGFKHIFFIGDHGGSQGPQGLVAAKLEKRWSRKGVVVAQIGDYYSRNGQEAWLLAQGFTAKQIGAHAGIRDTSELLAIRPQGIRAHPPGKPDSYGNSGDYRLATRKIGRIMLRLKIDAAVAQIKPYLKDRKDNDGPDPAQNREGRLPSL